MPGTAPPPAAFASRPGRWLLGCFRELRRDPLDFYLRVWRDQGDYARVRMVPGIHVYFLFHPDAVEHVLRSGHRNYRKPDLFNKALALIAGNGLIVSEGESWLKHRRMMQPAFRRTQMERLGASIAGSARALVREWEALEKGRPVDLLEAMMTLALRVAGRTLFDADIAGDASEAGRAYRTAFDHVSRRMNSLQLLPTWLPTPRNLRFARAKSVLDRLVLDMIRSHRKAPGGAEHLLAHLIAAQDEESGIRLTDEELKDEVLTLLTAGHETVGASLTWTWLQLGRHPEVQEQVFDEVRGLLGGRDPAVEDLARLPLTQAVFEESLRLYPPAWGQPREPVVEDEVMGRRIPRKSVVVLSQHVTHRHPDFWKDPERFDPGRFLPSQTAGRHPFAYFPFGGGPRICIGNGFAMIEGPLILATLVQRFRFELVPGQAITPDPTFTLRPAQPVLMSLSPR